MLPTRHATVQVTVHPRARTFPTITLVYFSMKKTIVTSTYANCMYVMGTVNRRLHCAVRAGACARLQHWCLHVDFTLQLWWHGFVDRFSCVACGRVNSVPVLRPRLQQLCLHVSLFLHMCLQGLVESSRGRSEIFTGESVGEVFASWGFGSKESFRGGSYVRGTKVRVEFQCVGPSVWLRSESTRPFGED